jgi:hypothetical protein
MRKLAVVFTAILLLAGCGREMISPDSAPAGMQTVGAPGHISWGQWSLFIEPESLRAAAVPVRGVETHCNVTGMLSPPKCTECLQIIIAGWDPVTRIADITLVLKNPTPLTGYDVKAIMSDYDTKEFLEPDAWCDFYTDGSWWQPYYIFAENIDAHAFGPGKSYARGFQVHWPLGATTHATVTVDVSYPGPQEEPWRINHVIVSGPLQNDFQHYIGFTCHVYDSQDNVQTVTANLTPIAPAAVILGDDALHRDFLNGDDIWGATNVKTDGAPSEYKFWLRAVSQGSSHPTYQELDLEVIPLASPQPKLYIVSMMHAEEADYFLQESVYQGYADNLRDLMALFDVHGAKIALQPDWTFIQGTVDFDPTLFSDFQAHGHGVDTHAHETTHDLGQVHDMLDAAGVTDTIIANGGFTKTWGVDGNWAAHIAHFETVGGYPMFLAVNGYKEAASQVIDSLFTPIRPGTTGDWMVHDPDGPLVYIAGGAIGLDSASPDFFADLPDSVDYALMGAVPGKINCFYWHDSVHNYPAGSAAEARKALWSEVLTSYFDPKVDAGVLVWANFTEMYQAYIDWE